MEKTFYLDEVLERAFEQAFQRALDQTVQAKVEECFQKMLSERIQAKVEEYFKEVSAEGAAMPDYLNTLIERWFYNNLE